ncbi:nitric oxide synthase oxygenase [Paenibacillus eucommiae]|uniref:Nitric oxide synthase oxygenase n=1 Tax=Paenibacillus eucommiae TaxID=1355755 RepID=A0ABS4IYK2_9BACL|nr:nitric oxide synthase oxygenase [Paenibacillus eucommiae]MBP1992056.1 nitric-oxide synthase [Paenibacillus eucommiae]
MLVKSVLMEKAEQFIEQYCRELGKSQQEMEQRQLEVLEEINTSGFYEHTKEELEYGAKMAWRNSNRCIGRFFWESLKVNDERKAETVEEMAEALYRHIWEASNGGKIIPMITVFKPSRPGGAKTRIWNYQLIRYAGYKTENGIIGDPDSLAFSELCSRLGWKRKGTPFDVLPLVLEMGNSGLQWFDIPEHLVLEVPISHPDFDAFADLQLRWYGVPLVSNMRLEIGGISYTAAPFNGWYMGTEIGARNLADQQRYNMLPQVAKVMGLDTKRETTLWRDRALVELNVAVLDSFKRHGVTIVDHHTAARQFGLFQAKESKCGRPVTGDWTWLIPPLSPATTPIFHQTFEDRLETPNFYYQNEQVEMKL